MPCQRLVPANCPPREARSDRRPSAEKGPDAPATLGVCNGNAVTNHKNREARDEAF